MDQESADGGERELGSYNYIEYIKNQGLWLPGRQRRYRGEEDKGRYMSCPGSCDTSECWWGPRPAEGVSVSSRFFHPSEVTLKPDGVYDTFPAKISHCHTTQSGLPEMLHKSFLNTRVN